MAMSLQEVKKTLRAGKFTWPGGYPMYFVMQDGGALSFEAVRSEWRCIVQAHLWVNDGGDPCWTIAGADINWEDSDLFCDHSGDRIESAYGED